MDYDQEPTLDVRCGTYAGWNAHRRRGERLCRPCLDAGAAYMSNLRLRTGRTRSQRRRRIEIKATGTGWV